MTQNTAGYVPIFDFGAPKIISAVARETISGGQFVFASGANNVVSSGANSFSTGDLLVAKDASGLNFTGVALHNAGSNETISVAIGGVIIAVADGTTTAGRTVVTAGGNAVRTGTTAGHVIGRALTSAGSEGHCLFQINP